MKKFRITLLALAITLSLCGEQYARFFADPTIPVDRTYEKEGDTAFQETPDSPGSSSTSPADTAREQRIKRQRTARSNTASTTGSSSARKGTFGVKLGYGYSNAFENADTGTNYTENTDGYSWNCGLELLLPASSYFSIIIGLDIVMDKQEYSEISYSYELVYMPIYLGGKIYFSSSEISPYVSFLAGYNAVSSLTVNDETYSDGEGGFHYGLAAGVYLYGIQFEISYTVTKGKIVNDFEEELNYTHKRAAISIGTFF